MKSTTRRADFSVEQRASYVRSMSSIFFEHEVSGPVPNDRTGAALWRAKRYVVDQVRAGASPSSLYPLTHNIRTCENWAKGGRVPRALVQAIEEDSQQDTRQIEFATAAGRLRAR